MTRILIVNPLPQNHNTTRFRLNFSGFSVSFRHILFIFVFLAVVGVSVAIAIDVLKKHRGNTTAPVFVSVSVEPPTNDQQNTEENKKKISLVVKIIIIVIATIVGGYCVSKAIGLELLPEPFHSKKDVDERTPKDPNAPIIPIDYKKVPTNNQQFLLNREAVHRVENISHYGHCVFSALAQAENVLKTGDLLYGDDLVKKRYLMQASFGANIKKYLETTGEKVYNGKKWKDIGYKGFRGKFRFTSDEIKLLTNEKKQEKSEYRLFHTLNNWNKSAKKLGKYQNKRGAITQSIEGWAKMQFAGAGSVVIDIVKLEQKNGKAVVTHVKTIDVNNALGTTDEKLIKFITLEQSFAHMRFLCIPNQLFKRIKNNTYDYEYITPLRRPE